MLEEQYAKHGKEFGPISQDQYLKMAQQLRDAKPGKNVLEMKSKDGGGAKFDLRNKAYVAWYADGVLKTFFVPAEGQAYFERQQRYADSPR